MSKLYERLVAYGNENISPFHMPGHKRKNEKYSFENPLLLILQRLMVLTISTILPEF